MAVLDNAAITQRLGELPDWQREGESIVRVIHARDFLAGIHLVTEVAYAAEQADHHPDIDIRYTKVRLALSSHDVGGITERDFDMAGRIDTLAGEADRGGGSGTAPA